MSQAPTIVPRPPSSTHIFPHMGIGFMRITLELFGKADQSAQRAEGRFVSVIAASNRAASVAKPGDGPFQRSWSTSSKSPMSILSVASLRNRSARPRSRESVCASALAWAAFTCHSRQSVGIDSRWPNLASTAAVDFAPQPGRPG
jgi:hypothetical protein